VEKEAIDLGFSQTLAKLSSAWLQPSWVKALLFFISCPLAEASGNSLISYPLAAASGNSKKRKNGRWELNTLP
jgi:hypothetical protein